MSYRNVFLKLTFEVPKVKHSPTLTADGLKCFYIQTYVEKGVITLSIDMYSDVVKSDKTIMSPIFGQHVYPIVRISELGYSNGSVYAMEACGGDRLLTALKGAILLIKRQWAAPFERRGEEVPYDQRFAFDSILNYCDTYADTLRRRLTQKIAVTHIVKPEGQQQDE